ncbi:MAG: hypothetical protein ACI9IT_002178, partial [Glaciecola sp.]
FEVVLKLVFFVAIVDFLLIRYKNNTRISPVIAIELIMISKGTEILVNA